MPTVKVKENFQVTIPTALRAAAGVAIGDYLEAALEGRSIVLKPKASTNGESNANDDVIKAAIEEGLRDVKAGKLIGPFSNMEEFEEYQAKKRKK